MFKDFIERCKYLFLVGSSPEAVENMHKISASNIGYQKRFRSIGKEFDKVVHLIPDELLTVGEPGQWQHTPLAHAIEQVRRLIPPQPHQH